MSAYEGVEIKERGHVTKLIIWLLGGWFFGIFLIFLVTVNNSLSLTPKKLQGSHGRFANIPEAQLPIYLHYIGSSLTRSILFFVSWIQMASAVIVCCLFFYSRRKSFLISAAFLLILTISGLFCLRIVPQFIRQGKLVDFLQYAEPQSPVVQEFQSLQTVMFFLALIQMVVLFYVAITLCLDRAKGEAGS